MTQSQDNYLQYYYCTTSSSTSRPSTSLLLAPPTSYCSGTAYVGLSVLIRVEEEQAFWYCTKFVCMTQSQDNYFQYYYCSTTSTVVATVAIMNARTRYCTVPGTCSPVVLVLLASTTKN